MNREERMVRKQVYLDHKQNDGVKYIAVERGVTESEVIREALDQYLAGKPERRMDPLVQLIGMANTRDQDGAAQHDRDIYLREREDR